VGVAYMQFPFIALDCFLRYFGFEGILGFERIAKL